MASLAGQLRNLLGRDAVLAEPGELAAYAGDAKVRGQSPLAVALPTGTEQVQQIVRLCAGRRLALIPRGAGTGTVGGAVPEGPAIVLDLSRMNRILSINADELTADVQAGVVNADLQAAVEKVGLFYPPDPASNATSTLGGNAATGAGGLRAIKYGVTANWILGLEVVLAGGEAIHTGVRTRKGVVGYDLTRLFIGSEGTLGIITALTLRLMPKPPAKNTLLAIFPTLAQAGAAVLAVLRSPVVPAAMELMDDTALRAVRDKVGELVPAGSSVLLLDVDGTPEEVDKQTALLAAALSAAQASEVRVARNKQDADRLWSARRGISPALYELRPNKIAEDVTVPVTRIAELIEGTARLAAELQLLHACYGHAGDGNIHASLLYDPADEAEAARAREGRERLFRLTLSLGGTISGEHGVGSAKRDFIAWEQSSALLDLQRRLKRTFDPLNILNPGKIFP